MLKPQKVIKQDGDSFTIQTFTSFKNYSCSFKIGEEFEEVTKGMDNRVCQVSVLIIRHITVSAISHAAAVRTEQKMKQKPEK